MIQFDYTVMFFSDGWPHASFRYQSPYQFSNEGGSPDLGLENPWFEAKNCVKNRLMLFHQKSPVRFLHRAAPPR